MINFSATSADAETIRQIVERAKGLFAKHGARIDLMSLTMDITACHLNGCPLKLQELLAADDFNFIHDVGGIRRHMDRSTGQLVDCFLPRYAQPEQRAAA